MAQPRRRALGLRAVLEPLQGAAAVKLPTLAAIRVIVATHAQYPARLLAAIDADIERERACQPEVTPMQFEEEESMMGAQIKTGPAGNRTLTAKTV